MAEHKRRTYEYQCYVTADLGRSSAGFPLGHEKRLVKIHDVLARDPSVMGPVVGARARSGYTGSVDMRRGGYDATFCVIASSIMAATVTAVCSLRNALDRADCENMDVSGVELRRFYVPAKARTAALEAAV